MRMRTLLAVLAVSLGCQSLPAAVAEPPRHVEIWGSLRRLHGGAPGAVVSLEQVLPGPHTYAVGALSELRGEITIIDDVAFLAYSNGGAVRVERGGARAERAALLVVARVPGWSEWRVESEVTFEQLDAFVETVALQQGYDVNTSLPVIIDGLLTDVRWHVLDGTQPPAASGEHSGGAIRGVFAGRGALIGFFSKNHQGKATHMGSNTHFHLVSGDAQISGHVDHAVIPAGAVIRFPKRR